jgi:hypothetical protein
MYAASVPVFRQRLTSLNELLDKAGHIDVKVGKRDFMGSF